MSLFEDRYWTSTDGLRLHYRDYAGPSDRPPLLCMHGLTRNARDFEGLAERLAGTWRVICPDMRGRGDSAYAKDTDSYNPVQYVRDLAVLFEEEGIERFITIGTSMGGLMTLIMAHIMPERIVASVLNDIGPDVEAEGLSKIRDYLGHGRNFPTWMHAARALEETHGAAFPDWEMDDWLTMAKRSMTLSSNGRIVFDYDMKIAEPFNGVDFSQQPDMWPSFAALAQRPVLVLRGALSNLFSEATFARMGQAADTVTCATVPQVGHAPTLDEPEAVAAIEAFLGKLA